MAGKSDLQAVLKEEYVSRNFLLINDSFKKKAGVDLQADVFSRLVMDPRARDSLCVLDVGSGNSEAIEQCTRGLMTTARRMGIQRPIQGIGVDINPIVDVSPEVLALGRDVGLGDEIVSSARKGDACALPIDDNSVDVLYSSNVLQYVADTLKALEEGWRVLKEGGVAYWHVVEKNISKSPTFQEILEATPGASEVFKFTSVGENDGFLVCRKIPGSTFKGFPFEVDKEVGLEDFNGVSAETSPNQLAHYYRSAVYKLVAPGGIEPPFTG